MCSAAVLRSIPIREAIFKLVQVRTQISATPQAAVFSQTVGSTVKDQFFRQALAYLLANVSVFCLLGARRRDSR